MSHFNSLLRHELRQQFHSLKFLTLGAFAVVFGLLSLYVQTEDYKSRKAVYDEEIIKAEQQLNEATVYSRLTVPIIVPPNPLSPFAKGVDDKVGNRLDINPLEAPHFKNAAQKQNPFLDIFEAFDLSTAVHILFSVMALFLVGDTIAGEREAGTLKQVFSNCILKSQYFLAKYLGTLGVLAVPLTLIFLIGALAMLLDPLISISTSQWLTVLMIYFSSVAFVSVYVLIGLALSARSSSAAQASLLGLMLWIALVFIYPNATRYLVNNTVAVPSSDEMAAEIRTIETQIADEVQAVFPQDGPGPASYNWCSIGKYNLASIIGATHRQVFEYHKSAVERGIPVALDGLDRIYQARLAHKRQFARQRETAMAFNRFLPGQLLTESASKMAGTHYTSRDLQILEGAKSYHRQLTDYIRQKGGFGYTFFTQMPETAMRTRLSDYNGDVLEAYLPSNYKNLNLEDMPLYTPTSRALIPRESLIDFMALILINLIFFILGGLLFSRSDVRARH